MARMKDRVVVAVVVAFVVGILIVTWPRSFDRSDPWAPPFEYRKVVKGVVVENPTPGQGTLLRIKPKPTPKTQST